MDSDSLSNETREEVTMDPVILGKSFLTEDDIFLFRQGNHFKLFDKLGSHLAEFDGVEGTLFAVWAPNAESVSVVGDFNGWSTESHKLAARWDSSGIWEGFIPGLKTGEVYKYSILSRDNNYRVEKGDPFARFCERAPRTASVSWKTDYDWSDNDWMKSRKDPNSLDSPQSVYEVHLGSWRRNPESGKKYMNYREIATQLAEYVKLMGFTHVELMPVMEHPFYGSWGYQTVGYFAPTSRYGTPQDFMFMIDHLHQNGIGVILDWVPSHFPTDEHGLAYFDGSHLYEHAHPKRGFHPDWQSYIFNHGRSEVRNFLISSALFWLEKYHIDGLRVDAVASMLYLDYSREDGEWIPNAFGGREDLDAIALLKRFNEMIYEKFPDTQTVAEESTDWPMVSRPAYVGGLGFGQKWNMGWMHDTLEYFCKDPVHRKYHHQDLTFSIWYAFTENFLLPLSHDEVVHGKRSLLAKMPGDDWQKFANLRLLFGYMYGHPGKKLIFMGGEFGQWDEWYHETSLDWHLLQSDTHKGVQRWLQDVNRVYRSEPALYELDFAQEGFEWVDLHDWEHSTMSFLRRGKNPEDCVLVACNFTPVPRENYRIGVPYGGIWEEILNSDAADYGGSGIGNFGQVEAEDSGSHGRPFSFTLTLPPLGVVFLRPKRGG